MSLKWKCEVTYCSLRTLFTQALSTYATWDGCHEPAKTEESLGHYRSILRHLIAFAAQGRTLFMRHKLAATPVDRHRCATERLRCVSNYDLELQQTTAPLKNGNIEGALSVIEANNPDPEKDLLYYFEKGAVLSAGGDFAQSQTTWRSADG
jgi:hypothetical protein